MKIERKKEIDVVRISHNWKLLLIIIFLIVILGVLVYFIFQNNKKDDNANSIAEECSSDIDCAPASCCHADSCVPINNKPECGRMFCSEECSSILDCGNGHCACVNNKCRAISK